MLSILILPFYVKLLGAEAYGLIGFFTMLQAWFALLDLGLTPTISRETARFRGGIIPAENFLQLFHLLSIIFIFIALAGGLGLWLLSEKITQDWLNVKELKYESVLFCVQVMALSVAARWMCGLYRGVIVGSERLSWLSAFNAFVATLRFLVVFLSMHAFGFKPIVFFMHQLAVAVVELFGIFMMAQVLLPSKTERATGRLEFTAVKPILKFSLSVAFTSSVWVLVTQTDKLILSGVLSLADYGYFTLAVLLAGGIIIIISPISTAVMPRMAKLYAEGKKIELIQLYRSTTQWVNVIGGSVSITMALCAKPVLVLWTGDSNLSAQAAPILQLYALGNGFLTIAAFPYYLQYARGDLRYHLMGNAGMLIVLIPTIIWAADKYGGVGAGYTWLTVNILFLFLWVPYVHRKIEPGLNYPWFINDLGKIYLPTAVVASLIFLMCRYNKMENFPLIASVATGAMFAAIGFSETVRSFVLNMLSRGKKSVH